MATASSPPTRLPYLLHPSPSRRLPFFTQAPLHPAAAASLPSWPLQLTLTVARRRRRPAPSGATAGSEEPSEPPPPYGNGWQARLSMFQDRVRIFFAVLFWMSLFFWGSAWDGSNNSGGKKRQRFRKKYK